MNRRTLLKALLTVPVALSLPKTVFGFEEYAVLPLTIEIRCGSRFVARRSIHVSSDGFVHYDFDLTRSEVERIDNWRNISLQFKGGPCQISSIEMSAGPTSRVTTRVRT